MMSVNVLPVPFSQIMSGRRHAWITYKLMVKKKGEAYFMMGQLTVCMQAKSWTATSLEIPAALGCP